MVTNMSHLAMVAEAPDGKLKVVEALMERNVVAYDLQDYLDLERLPRVAIYRAVASHELFGGSEDGFCKGYSDAGGKVVCGGLCLTSN